ncbi:helix-turn-helix transcriptional regulator [Streptomyces chartreusis]|uniref:helix-turn-helix transcriptional regulator n=1 Tax=Streptomyces chartreusis TaxID=1969 RepID=UPI0034119248
MHVQGRFVGRERELVQLRKCALAVRDGHPWVVLVEGEAGIGKTELLRAWLADRALEGFSVLLARCDASEQDFVFGAVQQLISSVPETLREEFPLLKGPVSTTAPPYEVGSQLLELVSALQAEHPVTIVIDDLQWADQASLQVWGFVLRRLEADAVLTLLTARTTPVGPDPLLDDILRRLMTGVSSSLRVPLQGLDTGDVAQLIEEATGRQVREAVADQLRKHTAGNPLYVSTVLAEVPDEELTAGPVTALPVPQSLAAGIRSQLLKLHASSRALVEAAAVLAMPTPLVIVGRMAGVQDPTEALGAALDTGLMRWRPNEPATPVEIGHALQRQAVVEAIPPDRLRDLHTIAQDLVDRQAAWAHRVAAAEPTDARLAAELAAAADEEFITGEVDWSATLLLWAADLEPQRADRERHLLTAAARLSTSDRFTRVASLLPRVQASSPCALRSLVLGGDAVFRGTLPEAEAHFAAALEHGDTEGDAWTALMARVWISAVYSFLGRYAEATQAAREALEMAPSDPWARAHLSMALGLGQGPQAALAEVAGATPSVMTASAEGRPVDAFLLTMQGSFQILAGAPTTGMEDCAKAIALGRSLGVPSFPDFAYAATASAQYLLGAWEDVPISVEHAHAITAHGDGMSAAFAWEHAVASWLAAGQGDWEGAEEHLDAVERRSGAADRDHASSLCAIGRALLAQAHGDHAALLAAVEPLARAEAGWSRLLQVFWLPLHTEALLGVGQLEQAELTLEYLQATAQEVPCLGPAAYWLSGQLAENKGDATQARRLYERGLEEESDADVVLLYRALLEHSYGALLHRREPGAGADRWFDAAYSRLQQMKARPFLERCGRDRPTPRMATPGLRSHRHIELTPRERDIGRLIGRGLTNKEIASELFVSSKTVEYHLSHIYEKLGFANRRELRDLVQSGNFNGEYS